MAPFLRISFIGYDWGNLTPLQAEPFSAVKMQESILKEQGWTMAQTRRTMYPAWQSSLDTHVVQGRVMTVVLMRNQEEALAEGTVNITAMAKHCINSGYGKSKYFVDLLPSGMVLLHLEIFREEEDVTDSPHHRLGVQIHTSDLR